jgi:hypothetical protein
MEIKTKIVVCGASYCSAHNYERDHFSQILEDEYGYEVINLATGGVGNIHACFQLQEAIKLGTDVIVYDRPGPYRIEIPISNQPFQPSLGLKNFRYPFKDESTYNSPYVGKPDAPFISDTIYALIPQDDPVEEELHNQFYPLSKEHREAVRSHLTFLFDHKLKEEVESWAFGYWEQVMIKNNIRAIKFSTVGKIAYDFCAATNFSYPKCYHTDRATQEIIANNIHKELQIKVANTD